MPERRQKLVFGEVAELYHRHRPRYPVELVQGVVDLTGIDRGGRALEVGAGTGIATEQFARHGIAITAVEPDEAMAAILRRNLPNVEVVAAEFEKYEAGEPFEFLYAAQSWHWIDPGSGFAQASSHLLPDGHIALIWNLEDPDQPLRPAGIDEVYAEFAAEVRRRAKPARLRSPEELSAGLVASDMFGEVEVLSYPWTATYTTADFISLQLTHSPNRLREPDQLERFLDGLAGVIDDNGGTLEVGYTGYAFVAKKL